MPISEYTVRGPAQFVPYQINLDALMSGLQAKQKRYDQYQVFADQIGQTSINALEKDRANANALVRQYNEMLDQTVEKYGGDYSKMGKDLYSLARRVKQDLSPGGEGFAYEKSLLNYERANARALDAVARGTIKPEQYEAWKNYSLNKYQGAVKDPVTQAYSTFEGEQISPYVDLMDLGEKVGKSIVPEMIQSGKWRPDKNGVLWEYTSSGRTRVTEDRIREVLGTAFANDPDYQAYKNQMARFGAPLDPAIEQGVIDTWATALRRDDRVTDHNIRWTPSSVLKARAMQAQAARQQRLRNTPEFTSVNAQDPPSVSDVPSGVRQYDSSLQDVKYGFIKGLGNFFKFLGKEGPHYDSDKRAADELLFPRPIERGLDKFGNFVNDAFENLGINELFRGAGEALDKHAEERLQKQTFEQYAQTPEFEEDFGPIGKYVYEAQKNAPQSAYNQATTEKEKARAIADAAAKFAANDGVRQSTYMRVGPETNEKWKPELIQSGFAMQTTYSGVDKDGNSFQNKDVNQTAELLGFNNAQTFLSTLNESDAPFAGYNFPNTEHGEGPLIMNPKAGEYDGWVKNFFTEDLKKGFAVMHHTDAQMHQDATGYSALENIDPSTGKSQWVSGLVGTPENTAYRKVRLTDFNEQTGELERMDFGYEVVLLDDDGNMIYQFSQPITDLSKIGQAWAKEAQAGLIPMTGNYKLQSINQ